MEIHLPDEIKHYEGELRYFIDTMVRKLHTNRHKGFADGKHPVEMFNGAEGEMKELRDALLHRDQFAAFVEAADVANMVFLTGLAAVRMTRDEFDYARTNKDE